MSIQDFLKEGDKVLKCHSCPNDFIYPKSDQLKDKQRGFSPPRNCNRCRWMIKRGLKPIEVGKEPNEQNKTNLV